MKPNNNGAILKSDKQLLREAGIYINQLEQEAKKGAQDIETLTIMVARYRVSLMAVGIHFKITPAQMQEIVTPYLDKQMEEIQRQLDEVNKEQLAELEKAKTEFKEKLKRGEKVDFIVKDRIEDGEKPAAE